MFIHHLIIFILLMALIPTADNNPFDDDNYKDDLSYVILSQPFDDLVPGEVYAVTRYDTAARTVSITHNYRTYKIHPSTCLFRSLTQFETLVYREEVVILRTHKAESIDGAHQLRFYAGDVFYVHGFCLLEEAYTIIDEIKYGLTEGYYEHKATFDNLFNFTKDYANAGLL